MMDEGEELHVGLAEAIGRMSSAAIDGHADRMMALEGVLYKEWGEEGWSGMRRRVISRTAVPKGKEAANCGVHIMVSASHSRHST